jgi:hypothetical protein
MLTAEHPSTSRPARVFEHDRRCSRPGCITVLCHFNVGPECYVHTDQARVESQRREAVERDELLEAMAQSYGVRVAA